MKKPQRWTWLVVLVFALALLAAGCGGGDDEATDDGAPAATQAAAEQVITINWGTEPPSLDPGLASDTTSANILFNIMDPLVKLGDDLEPVPSLAESWEVSKDGKTVTFKLRSDGKWTNGDPVTAKDFEYSWKRTVSPELAADYAYQFYGIEGAQEYNGCKKNCEAMADKMGVKAIDDTTLEVTLTTAQPWFIQQAAHHSFLAVHRPTVEKFKAKWTEAANIVTNGPFKLDRWEHDSRIDIVKNEQWRNAGEVSLTRVNGRMISDGTTAVQAFEAGEIDVTGGPPPRRSRASRKRPSTSRRQGLGRTTTASTSRTSPTRSSVRRWRWRFPARRSSTTSPRRTSSRRPASRRRVCRASTRSTPNLRTCHRRATSSRPSS